jgi:iron complex outermembrane receptor protein
MHRYLDFQGAAVSVTTTGQTPNAKEAVAASEIEGQPVHKIFLYAAWKATRQLTLTPSIEIATDRKALVTDCGTTLTWNDPGNAPNTGGCASVAAGSPAERRPNYVKLGSYALVNFQGEYAWDRDTTLALGVTNLFDQDYQLAQGFPEPGRQFYANARVKF